VISAEATPEKHLCALIPVFSKRRVVS
jgi:hypothetical protein